MFKLVKLGFVLFRIKLLSLVSIGRLTRSIYSHGINLLALLSFSAKSYRGETAVVDEEGVLSYEQLYKAAVQFSVELDVKYGICKGRKVAIIARNHSKLMTSIYAVSGTGADLFLLNTELSHEQHIETIKHHHFDLVIADEALFVPLAGKLPQYNMINCNQLDYTKIVEGTQEKIDEATRYKRKHLGNFGRLVILTGGTTGKAKQAAHKPSLFNYLNPFYSFIMRLKLNTITSAYIATPIFHGYGIAVMLLCHALGKKVYVTSQFQAKQACQLVESKQIQLITVVPIMLHRMLHENSEALYSLTCIASGGAELNPKLVDETMNRLGLVLYNLYGTSEAGLNMIATPEDLLYHNRTVGRPIAGGEVRILNTSYEELAVNQIGQLCVKNSWSMFSRSKRWIETGDLAYRDSTGRFYLCGRTDSMIVSGGENVYPYEIEQLILTHQKVEDAAVIPVSDIQFGQRLVVYFKCKTNEHLTEEELQAWIKPKLARFQMPKHLYCVDAIPYTTLGKKDKKRLLAEYVSQ